MTKWNKWHENNRLAEIWLQGAELWGAHLEDADLGYVHLEGANLTGANPKKARLEGTHLEATEFTRTNLKAADFSASVVDGSTLIWKRSIDLKTDFRGVGLDSCRIDQGQIVVPWLIPVRSIYFSIVTMTTLGFGDMYANSNNYPLAVACGHFLLGFQVLLGYVLLAALVTQIGVLFTSGVIPGQFKKNRRKPEIDE